MDIEYAIISYNRAGRVSTLDLLQNIGIPKEKIIISLNDPKDYEEYKRYYCGRVKEIICKEKHNVNGNCNNVLDYYSLGQRFVLLDDDVRKIQKYSRHSDTSKYGKLIDVTEETFWQEIEYMFGACEYHGAEMFGVYPVNNKIELCSYWKKKEHFSVNRLFQGGLMGLKKGSARFDENLTMLNDYDMQLQYLSHDIPILRDNQIVLVKSPNGKTRGGLESQYAAGEDRICLKRLKHKYGDLLTIKKGYKGITLNRKAIG